MATAKKKVSKKKTAKKLTRDQRRQKALLKRNKRYAKERN